MVRGYQIYTIIGLFRVIPTKVMFLQFTISSLYTNPSAKKNLNQETRVGPGGLSVPSFAVYKKVYIRP